MVGKKPSVKADLAIYSQAVDVRGRCMSESLKPGHNLDFSSCNFKKAFNSDMNDKYKLTSISLVLICFLKGFVEVPNNKGICILCRCKFTSTC